MPIHKSIYRQTTQFYYTQEASVLISVKTIKAVVSGAQKQFWGDLKRCHCSLLDFDLNFIVARGIFPPQCCTCLTKTQQYQLYDTTEVISPQYPHLMHLTYTMTTFTHIVGECSPILFKYHSV